MKDLAVLFSPSLARSLWAICALAAGPTLALAQQPATQPLAVNQLQDAVNAAVTRLNGNLRVSLDSCGRESEDAVCYSTLSKRGRASTKHYNTGGGFRTHI